MVRITTGSAKNINIAVPDIDNIRLVQDIVKLAIFSILGEKIVNSKCLDLYAGSGSLGIEALSRAAQACDFVDKNKKAIKTIQDNLLKTHLQDKGVCIHSDVLKYVANTDKKYDVIFADPFYEDVKHKYLFENLEEILNSAGYIVFLHGENIDINEQISNTQLKIITTRRFGKSYFDILSH